MLPVYSRLFVVCSVVCCVDLTPLLFSSLLFSSLVMSDLLDSSQSVGHSVVMVLSRSYSVGQCSNEYSLDGARCFQCSVVQCSAVLWRCDNE